MAGIDWEDPTFIILVRKSAKKGLWGEEGGQRRDFLSLFKDKSPRQEEESLKQLTERVKQSAGVSKAI